MQAQELIKYINNPALLSKESIPLLQKLVSDFPYFQSGHILLSLAAKRWDSSVYQQSIKKTAIIVTNRSHLYNLVHRAELINEEAVAEVQEVDKPMVEPVTENKKEEAVSIPAAEKIAEKIETKESDPLSGLVVAIDENAVEAEVEKALVASIVEKEITEASELLNPEKKEQPANFADWLHFLKKNNGEPYNEIEEKVNKQKNEKQKEQASKNKQKQKELIDKIIDTNPGLIRQKEEQKFFKSDFKAKESLLENEHLVTETLARIYAMQGNINKAIRAYEILSIRFPQKSAHFTALIQKLKSNQ